MVRNIASVCATQRGPLSGVAIGWPVPLSSDSRPARELFGMHCGIDFHQRAVTPNPSLQRTTPGRSPGRGR